MCDDNEILFYLQRETDICITTACTSRQCPASSSIKSRYQADYPLQLLTFQSHPNCSSSYNGKGEHERKCLAKWGQRHALHFVLRFENYDETWESDREMSSRGLSDVKYSKEFHKTNILRYTYGKMYLKILYLEKNHHYFLATKEL